MKTTKNHLLAVLTALITLPCSTWAQQQTTLYFLENAPMRHIVNPAFQPVSDGYINFTPLGYTSMWVGNNSLTMSDVIYNKNGSTITAMHPDGDRQKLLQQIRNVTLTDADLSMDLLSFGFRHKRNGYVHVGVVQRLEVGVGVPKTLFSFLLDGGMQNATGVNTLNLTNTSMRLSCYTELSGGYSYKINDKWTVGGKLKVLLGQANALVKFKSLKLDASAIEWYVYGDGNLQGAAPVNWDALPKQLNSETLRNFNFNKLQEGMSIMDYIIPQGYGAGLDLGFTYKPHPQVQITAALNDLGFIVWNGVNYTTNVDSAFTGVDGLKYSDYSNAGNNYQFDGNKFGNDFVTALQDFSKCLHTGDRTSMYTRMLSAKLNVGVDANFLDNVLGVGIVSKTRMFNGRFYEEVTLGGAVRPCNWFNLALTYSLINNGRYSNFGAGLSFMPYDGINLTLAMDYIPTSFAQYESLPVPYQIKGYNLALGFSIVWGTNKKKDSDKDGVPDKFDLCPGTPASVAVDKNGCPIDTDGDGVPDYLDLCPYTCKEAYKTVDKNGCPIDSDGDGVPDYRDKCVTLPEAIQYIDSTGCDKDSDHDGVPDYLDHCPGTLPQATGFVDAQGCDLDSDHDGVPDYKDQCPNTEQNAIAYVNENGCDRDFDQDGVPDYLDECPTVAGVVENKGCPVIQKEIRNLLKQAMQGIQFESGKAIIKKSSYPMLDEIAQVFMDNPDYLIEVQGHTDSSGKYENNMSISQRRADAVKDYLTKAGIATERMTAMGYGPDRPIADNNTQEGRALNRRVEFIITFEQITLETIYDHADAPLNDSIAAMPTNDSIATVLTNDSIQ